MIKTFNSESVRMKIAARCENPFEINTKMEKSRSIDLHSSRLRDEKRNLSDFNAASDFNLIGVVTLPDKVIKKRMKKKETRKIKDIFPARALELTVLLYVSQNIPAY